MSGAPAPVRRHPMAASIRLPLLALYLALALPLPVQAPADLRPWLLAAVLLGLLAVSALTSERVVLDTTGLRLEHPPWCAWFLRRGWSLPWGDVAGLVPVATSQGGRVFYIRRRGGDGGQGPAAVLLPQRVARFEDFLEEFSRRTGIDTGGIDRLTPPWTYRLLGVLAGALLLAEAVATVARPLAPG